MLQAVPWFLLGSLWAFLFSEYRGFRRRLKLSAHIRALETDLAASAEEHFDREQAFQQRVRAELQSLLGDARASRAGRAAAAE